MVNDIFLQIIYNIKKKCYHNLGKVYYLGGIMRILYGPNYKVEEASIIAFGKLEKSLDSAI